MSQPAFKKCVLGIAVVTIFVSKLKKGSLQIFLLCSIIARVSKWIRIVTGTEFVTTKSTLVVGNNKTQPPVSQSRRLFVIRGKSEGWKCVL